MTVSFTSIQKGDKTQFSIETKQIQRIYVKEGGDKKSKTSEYEDRETTDTKKKIQGLKKEETVACLSYFFNLEPDALDILPHHKINLSAPQEQQQSLTLHVTCILISNFAIHKVENIFLLLNPESSL